MIYRKLLQCAMDLPLCYHLIVSVTKAWRILSVLDDLNEILDKERTLQSELAKSKQHEERKRSLAQCSKRQRNETEGTSSKQCAKVNKFFMLHFCLYMKPCSQKCYLRVFLIFLMFPAHV